MSEDEVIPALDLPAKKKTKKKKDTTGALPGEPEPAPVEPSEPVAEPVVAAGDDEPVALDLPAARKKKTKKPKVEDANGEEEQAAALANDYTYETLLTRAYAAVKRDHPDMENDGRGINVEAPALVRVGTKRTGFVNFKTICTQMDRPHDHVLAFVLAELGTTGSFAANNRLTVKGRFQQKHIENVMRHYISTYVLCANCKSSSTALEKESRLQFVRCQTCHSRRSVATISSGFQAQVGRRKKV